ncbi:MAG: hypothetical protein Kow0056_05210 [Coriobacteriia bacterium]
MMWGYGGMGTSMWGGWIGMILMGLFWLLVLAGIVLLVIWIARAAGGSGQGPSGTGRGGPQGGADDPAVRIARERFARGEITKEELDEILRTLGA